MEKKWESTFSSYYIFKNCSIVFLFSLYGMRRFNGEIKLHFFSFLGDAGHGYKTGTMGY